MPNEPMISNLVKILPYLGDNYYHDGKSWACYIEGNEERNVKIHRLFAVVQLLTPVIHFSNWFFL